MIQGSDVVNIFKQHFAIANRPTSSQPLAVVFAAFDSSSVVGVSSRFVDA
jgi:hypothetical protein